MIKVMLNETSSKVLFTGLNLHDNKYQELSLHVVSVGIGVGIKSYPFM